LFLFVFFQDVWICRQFVEVRNCCQRIHPSAESRNSATFGSWLHCGWAEKELFKKRNQDSYSYENNYVHASNQLWRRCGTAGVGRACNAGLYTVVDRR
jgi:hypothetical protein